MNKINRETKVILLNVLRKGYFTDDDVKFIANKTGLDTTFLDLAQLAAHSVRKVKRRGYFS